MRCSSNEFDWSAVAIVRLQLLWAEGHSTTEIGRRMGVSKNAIVGKGSPAQPTRTALADPQRWRLQAAAAATAAWPNPAGTPEPTARSRVHSQPGQSCAR